MTTRHIYLMMLVLALLPACGEPLSPPVFDNPRDEKSANYVNKPELQTNAPTHVRARSARVGGLFMTTYGKPVSVKGACWSQNPDPTLEDTCTDDGAGTSNFVSDITGLLPNTVYHVRAYATNDAGTVYGATQMFRTTDGRIALSQLIQVNPGPRTATVTVTIDSDGGDDIVTRGVCLATHDSPGLNDHCQTNGVGIGAFPVAFDALETETTYHIRAFATNSIETAVSPPLTFTTLANQPTMTDIDGNIYPIVQINSQWWMAANLMTSRYRDGTPIPNVASSATWSSLTSGAWVHYGQDPGMDTIFGKLYNWYAANNGNRLCPAGWHVPSDTEWADLVSFLGPAAGHHLKSNSSWQGGGNGSNISGFNGLPAGYRHPDGQFANLGTYTYFWSSTSWSSDGAWYRVLASSTSEVQRFNYSKRHGFSVRCVMD